MEQNLLEKQLQHGQEGRGNVDLWQENLSSFLEKMGWGGAGGAAPLLSPIPSAGRDLETLE